MKRTRRWLVAGALALALARPALGAGPGPAPAPARRTSSARRRRPSQPSRARGQAEPPRSRRSRSRRRSRRRRAAGGGARRPPGRRGAAGQHARGAARDDAILGAGGAEPRPVRRRGAREPAEDRRPVLPARPDHRPRGADARRLGAVARPSLLDAYLDARPNTAVRGFVLGPHELRPHRAARPAAQAPADGRRRGTGGSMGSADLTSLFATGDRGPHASWTRCGCASTSTARCSSPRASSTCAGARRRFWHADRLPARPPAQPAGRVRRPHRHHHAEAARALGGAGLELLRLRPARGRRPARPRSGRSGRRRPRRDRARHHRGGPGRPGPARTASPSWPSTSRPASGTSTSTARWPCATAARSTGCVVRARPGRPARCESRPAVIERLYPVDRDAAASSRRWSGASHYSRRTTTTTSGPSASSTSTTPSGTTRPEVYPGLILPRLTPLAEPATFFYLGRHYGAVFLSVPAPYSWDYTTFTLSTLGNFSDGSLHHPARLLAAAADPPALRGVRGRPLRHQRGRVPLRRGQASGSATRTSPSRR